MKRTWIAPLSALGLLAAAGAPAAMIVHDPTNYLQLVAQAQTALDQLQSLREQALSAKRMVRNLEEADDLGELKDALADPALDSALPDARGLRDLLQSGGSGGRLAERAQAIREAHRILPSGSNSKTWQALDEAGLRAARDMAIAEAATSAAADRQTSLDALHAAIATAGSTRTVLDLQAYAASAEAQAANDHLRLQALALAQAAEARLIVQAEAEAVAQARAARMARYRAGFADEAGERPWLKP